MSRFTMSRRALLQGTGMAGVALPFLEIMGEGRPRAASKPVPRYLLMYAGVSLTRDSGGTPNLWQPETQGPGYKVSRDLSPIGKQARDNGYFKFGGHDVQDDVSVVTGLKIPWAAAIGQALPKAGKPPLFHGYTMNPLLCGMTATAIDSHTTPSSDQIVASSPSITLGTRFPSLQYGVQPDPYLGYGGNVGNMSYGFRGRALPPQTSPNAAFMMLSRQIAGPSGASVDPKADAFFRQDKSILDHLVSRASRLAALLGNADRQRMDAHFSQIRDLEVLLKATPINETPSCHKPASPGADPAITRGVEKMMNTLQMPGHSSEVDRAVLMRGFLYLALTCGLTRVATLVLTYRQSYMSTEAFTGRNFSVHDCGHMPASLPEMQDMLAWHVEHFAWLARQLKNAIDVDGSPMLDNTVMAMCTEGGAGVDPVAPDDPKPHNHSTENMSMLVAGGRNLGLQPGRSIAGNGAHPASVLRRCMKAVGVDQPLGEIDDPFPDL